MKRFNNIMRMHISEVPSKEKQVNQPTLNAFNDHMKGCLTPGKHSIIDEIMNQQLGVRMLNLKKVPRKPQPIGQEFKPLADYYPNTTICLDTVSDPQPKEFDNEPGIRNLLDTVKRLAKP
jgi:hypothetical protein